MRLVQVLEDKVVNVSVAAEGQAIPDGWLQSDTAQIGWGYVGGEFIAPPPRVRVVTKEDQEKIRASLYRKEADPLFFKAQRGEATMEEWQAKVEEIKARFPYPETQL